MTRAFQQLLVLFFLSGAMPMRAQSPKKLISPAATAETQALYANLDRLAAKGVLFGHQHATEYGHGWTGKANRSDVKSVTGSHPAVIGVDFSGLSGQAPAVITKYRKALKKNIADTYDRGGVVTVAWHFYNPVSPTGFYWNDSTAAAAVPMLIPGGTHHEVYKKILRDIASFAKDVRGKDGKLVPMIFRPYHEMDGDWFWWGKKHNSAEEFKTIWRFTVNYLRDSLGVPNFIYAFSPDAKFNTEQEFLERYPGDEWVDMVGMDNYYDFGRDGRYDLDAGIRKLQTVGDYAKKSNKLVAFTETGLESIPDPGWWTDSLMGALKRSGVPLSYVLVWRNDAKSKTHYYAPYPGHSSVPDFMKFYQDPYTLFENDLPDMYRIADTVRSSSFVDRHGALQVIGTLLCDERGSPLVLRGMSFGWHNLWPRFYNAGAVETLVDDWNSSVVRAAMGIELNDRGYLADPESSVNLMKAVVEACIKKGVYVIIDWHDHNLHPDEAIKFFREMARMYGKYPNIIYEIVNEPDHESWPEVKDYAQKLIAAIRAIDPDNIILVGSPRWDQDIHLPAADPIQGVNNIMYTLHFYAATHKEWLRKRADEAIAMGLPLFVSESAPMEATGDGPLDITEWNRWVDWMEDRKISWVTWSVSDKDETCSVLKKSASSNGGWPVGDLKESGVLVREKLRRFAK